MTRKSLIKAGAGLLVLSMVALVPLGIYFDRAATRAANDWLTAAFPVPASVDSVKVRLLSGTLEFSGLRIANPQGFVHKEFLTLKRGEMEVRLSSLLSGEIISESVRTDGLVVRLEKIDGRQNAREIFPTASRKDSKEADGKRFRIRRIIVKNVLLSFPVPEGEQVATVERLEMEEPLGKDRSALLREVIGQAIARSVRAGAGQAVERALAGTLSAVRDGAGKAGKAGKSAGDRIR